MQWAQNIGQRLRGYTQQGGGGNGDNHVPLAEGPEEAAASPVRFSIASLVQSATHDMLLGPDWGQNMALVDAVNQGINGRPGVSQEQALKYLKKPLTGSSPHQQLLALTALEACAKNCGPTFHQKLAFSDVWATVQMMTNKKNQDTQVFNKCLEVVQDWAHGLQYPTFSDFYNSLLKKGVVFPRREVATPEDFIQPAPPSSRPATSAAGRTGNLAPQAVPQGVSEADRLAIEAAMAEFAAEDQRAATFNAAGGGGYQPPSLTTEELPVNLGLGPVATGATGAPPGAITTQQLPTQPPLAPPYSGPNLSTEDAPAEVLKDLETAKGMVSLLDEMVAAIPANNPAEVLQDHIREVAEQAVAMRPRVHKLAESATDEAVLMATFALNEQLESVLMKHDGLVAAAAAGPRPNAQGVVSGHLAGSTAGAVAPPPALPPPPGAGTTLPPPAQQAAQQQPLINLMDDDLGAPSAASGSGAGPSQAPLGADPFLPVSTNLMMGDDSPLALPAGPGSTELAESFEQMVGVGTGAVATASGAAPASRDLLGQQAAGDFEALTRLAPVPMRSGPSTYVGESPPPASQPADPKGKAPVTEG